MGNVLNPIGARIYRCRLRDYQLELWSILIFRAMSEYIYHKLVYKKGMANDQSKVWRILLHRAMSGQISNKQVYGKTIEHARFLQGSSQMFHAIVDYIQKSSYETCIAHGQLQLSIILLWRAISGYIYHKTICNKRTPIDQVINLPEDLQCIILSKLPLKEVVRTSILSSKWRRLWTVCPKLRFDGTAMFSKKMDGKQCKKYTRQFINTINTVLQQYHGRAVEELAIKFEFDTLLIDHLNNWVGFAASSYTKFLALDLIPRGLEAFDDPQYIFPLQLFDRRSINYLQQIHLRFVVVKLPLTQFSGFPKLQKLDLHKVKITAKDFQDMLSNCCALEWLSIVFCKMDGELKVHSPLPCLVHLNVEFCELTKIELCAVKLRTFVYEGSAVPIKFREVSELENAKILLCGVTFGDAIPALANVLTNVQNLTLNFFVHPPKVPCLMENRCNFSHLKHLQLLLSYKLDIDNLSLVPFLGSAPFIEKLEIHFSSIFGFFYLEGASIRRFEHRHNYLKDICITGFKASNGQIEFLVHIVENTPTLEILTVDQCDRVMKNDPVLIKTEVAKYMDSVVYGNIRRYIEATVSPKCYLRLLF